MLAAGAATRQFIKSERNLNLVLKPSSYQGSRQNKKSGDVVNRPNNRAVEQKGFTTEDILWATGIWSVILCLSPVIFFYVLMVA